MFFFSYYSSDLPKQVLTSWIKFKIIEGIGMYDSTQGDVLTISNHPILRSKYFDWIVYKFTYVVSHTQIMITYDQLTFRYSKIKTLDILFSYISSNVYNICVYLDYISSNAINMPEEEEEIHLTYKKNLHSTCRG